MARRSRLWWDAERRQWCVSVRGQRYRLGGDYDAATAAWLRLLAGDPPAPLPTAPPAPAAAPAAALTVGELLDAYLAALPSWASRHAVSSSYHLLTPLVGLWGRGRPVAGVAAADFEAVASRRKWGRTTRSLAKQRWTAMCNWAIRGGLIDANPLRGLRTPAARSRGVEALLRPGEFDALVAAAAAPLRDVLVALHDTGCRPGEALAATAAEFDAAKGLWRFGGGKNGLPRTVLLTERVAKRCVELAATAGGGPLYEFARGGRVEYRVSYLGIAIGRLRRKLGLRRAITAYSFRHTLATELLAAGTPDAAVAELLGHSVRVLHRVYVHLMAKPDALRDALNRVRGDQS